MKVQSAQRKVQRGILTLIAAMSVTSAASGQWLNHPDSRTPRTRDGKPNLAAPAPRASGRPDLSGVWQAEASPIPELMKIIAEGENGLGEDIPSKYFFNLFADYRPEQIFLRPSDAADYRQRAETFGAELPITRCLPAGVPLMSLVPAPFKIVQTPWLVVMLSEDNTTFRQIFTDGRTHPKDPQP